jgi:hypothetical protein
MARRSAASLEVVGAESPRLPVPRELSEEEASIWNGITAAMPASWFDSGNQPVLVELCRHAALANKIAEELATLRKRKLTAQQRAIFLQLLGMAASESKLIASLSVKLRLVNSSHRRDERYDDRLKHRQPQGPRPWERQRQ